MSQQQPISPSPFAGARPTSGPPGSSPPASAPTAAAMSSAVSRLTFLDGWVAKRIAEAQDAEAKLALRLQHMDRAQKNLTGLSESIRKHVTAARPLLADIAEFRKDAAAKSEQLLTAARGQLSEATQLAQSRLDSAQRAEADLAAKLAEYEKAMSALSDQAQTQASRLMDDAPSLIEAQLEPARQQLRQAIEEEISRSAETWKHSAADLAATMRAKLEVLKRGAADVTDVAQGVLRESMDVMHTRAQAAAEPVLRELGAQAGRLEQRAQEISASTRDLMHRHGESLAADAQHKADAVRDELSRMWKDVRADWDASLLTSQAQMRSASAATRADLERELEALRATGESIAADMEEKLNQRMNDLRPRIAAVLESATTMMQDRLAKMLETAKSMLDLHELQLTSRIEAIRPLAAAAVRAAETEVAQELAKMEQEAQRMTAAVENRLIGRVEELTSRSRQVLYSQTTELNASMPNPVEVSVFVKPDQMTAREDSAAA